MKTRLFFGFAVCCFLVSLILVAGLTASKGAQAQSQGRPSALPASFSGVIGGGSKAFSSYKIIRGFYYQEGTIIVHEGWYTITNTNISGSITLGPIYVVERNGINGSVQQWNGLVGESIPPLGSRNFHISETGIQPTKPSDDPPRGPLSVIVTWDGIKETTELTGHVISRDDTDTQIGTMHVKAF